MVTHKLKSKKNMSIILKNDQLVNNSNLDPKNVNGVDSLIKDTTGFHQVELNGFKNPINEKRFPFLNKGLKSILNQRIINLNVDEIDIPAITGTIYDYSNREDDIKSLEESMKVYKQQKPILVICQHDRYVLVDGYLRIQALKNLEINFVRCIVADFEPANEDELGIFIVNNQIHKEKRASEKLNEVRYLLRIGMDKKNPNRDKEERISTITNLLGKGFDRNNVYFLQNVIEWEDKNPSFNLGLQNKIVNNELKVATGLEVFNIIDEYSIILSETNRMDIVNKLIGNEITPSQCRRYLDELPIKSNQEPTDIELQNYVSNNFRIIEGNIEKIDLPEDLKYDLLLTSPPYYKLKKYGNSPDEIGWEKTPKDYAERISLILLKCAEHLTDTGSMFINVGETYDNLQCLGIIDRLTLSLMDCGLVLVDKIIWNKVGGKPLNNTVKRLIPGYEMILHFAKSTDYFFEKVKLPKKGELKLTRTCGEEGCKNGYFIPNNFTQLRSVLDENEVTKIKGYSEFSNIIKLSIGKNRTKFDESDKQHHATFSANLGLIPMLSCCPKSNDTIVFDPFSGTGTTGVTALSLGFKYVGVELYPEFVKKSKKVLYKVEKNINEQIQSKTTLSENNQTL